MTAEIHLWALFDAPSVGVKAVHAGLKAGARLLELSAPYGSTGGAAQFTHALVYPDGRIAKVSDKTFSALGMSQDALQGMGVLAVCMQALRLDVPFAEKDLAKAAGARWHGGERCWMIDPDHQADCQRWLPGTSHWISLA